jgi:hypothetical protein
MPMLLPRSAFDDYMRISDAVASVRSVEIVGGELNDTAALDGEVRRFLAVDKGGIHPEGIHFLWNTLAVAMHMERVGPEHWRRMGYVRDCVAREKAVAPFSNTVAWRSALATAARVVSDGSPYDGVATRQASVAQALTFFEQHGHSAIVDGHGARLSHSAYNATCKKILKHVHAAGGEHFANTLLRGMSETGRIIDGSFTSARLTMSGQEQAAETPFHYLYNLAFANIDVSPCSSDPLPHILKAEKWARHFAAALDVQPHSVYENTQLPSVLFERVLRETAVYDELFALPQWQPVAARTLVEEYIRSLANAGCEFPIVGHEVWIALWRFLNGACDATSLTTLAVGRLMAAIQDVSALSLLEMIKALGGRASANRGYRTPSDAALKNATAFPLIELSDGRLILHPRPIMARSFVERLQILIREQSTARATTKSEVGRFETKLGDALEKLTAAVLDDAGEKVTVMGGRYFPERKGSEREIDLVVETPARIFLFECKRKALTSGARAGGLHPLFLDLTRSFLAMQAQLARHEASLRQNGKIEFLNGYVLELHERKVERIAVSLFDHGALQDRGMVMPLLERVIGHTVTSSGPGSGDLAGEMNKHLGILTSSVKSILSSNPERDFHGFLMATWWLSIDQLQYLCGNGKGLNDGLGRLRHLTTRSGDVVWENHRTRNLNVVGEALLDLTRRMDNRAVI